MSNAIKSNITDKLNGFKKRFYLNLLVKGTLLFLGCGAAFFMSISIAEYWGHFGSGIRTFLFFGFLMLFMAGAAYWVLLPLSSLLKIKRQISDHEAALRVGESLPQISDKLLNTLQLSQALNNTGGGNNSLMFASISQNSQYLDQFDFNNAISIKEENKKYFKWVVPVLLLFLALFSFKPDVFKDSTQRIVNFDQEFKYAPFDFILENQSLRFFKGEDAEIQIKTKGTSLPAQMYVISESGRRLKMNPLGKGEFGISISQVQAGFSFHFSSSGYNSQTYNLEVVARPSLSALSTYLEYPSYIKKNNERLDNSGNLLIPEGTVVNWDFKAQNSQKLSLIFSDSSVELNSEENAFKFRKQIRKPQSYRVELTNEYSTNKEPIEYHISVIPDEFPKISLQQYQDSSLFQYLILGGNISDDYGLSNLLMKYRVTDAEGNAPAKYSSKKIKFNPNINAQNYYEQINLADLNLKKGETIEYYVEVWDNDRINGSKKSKTGRFKFKLPSSEEISKDLNKDSKTNEKKIEKTLEKSQELQKQIEAIEDKLKGKKQLSWQDKKSLEELIEKNKALSEEMKKIQQMHKDLMDKQSRFNQPDPKISEKIEQLNKLMDSVLDEETKKLYEELEKLMQRNDINEKLQDALKDIKMNEKNMERNLDKALEMMKRLQVDQKVQDIKNKLEDLAEKQEEAAEENEGKEDKSNQDTDNQGDIKEKSKKQDEINKEFDKIQEDLKELEKMNDDLKNPKQLDSQQKEQEQVDSEQQKSSENLQQNKPKEASESQKKAAEKMKEMAQRMAEMQQNSESVETNENYEDLRQILDNLITLSFDQETIFKDFREVKQVDPKFIDLSQKQLKLQSDSKIIEDSLLALSKRVMQIESFVTKELNSMNKYIDASVEEIKKRNPAIAAGKQQLAMTSINNLALLLNDILSQMQMQMSQSMGGQQMNQQNKGNMSMSQLQQKLNQQIQELKKSGKSGRQLSEALGKLAAEQEMLRNALKKAMEGKQKGNGKQNGKDGDKGGMDGGNISDILEKMEMTEEDLVNKRITEETIQRQKEILTRLLESEKADKERELDEKREAEQAKSKEKSPPESFKKYLEIKEKQIEMLKSVPTSLTPFYKREVNEYFNKFKSKQ